MEPLTTEMELELYKKANKGDAEAVEQLVCTDIDAVISTAKRYFRPGVTMEEMIIAGIKALRRYYATAPDNRRTAWSIRQVIIQLLQEKGLHDQGHERS